jgi:exopolysaccharide production protein ExoQ
MGAPLALLLCAIGVAGLFYLDRDKSVRTSVALWLPVIWLWIIGSRPVSAWLGVSGGSADTLAASLDGSPMDAAVYAVLLALGILVLFKRGAKTRAYLPLIAPVLIYFLYCLISVLWSPIHGPAFKRWTKAVGDLVMVLVIATDAYPVTALRRVFSRVGFVLLPLSPVLIRYTVLGRGFDPDGRPENIGVTTNKNDLGLIAFVISLGALWNVRSLLIHKDEPNRKRRLLAQVTLLAFGLTLLEMAHCATGLSCFILGSSLLLITGLQAIRLRPRRVHLLVALMILLGGIAFLFGGEGDVAHALGRSSNLSGRLAIWQASLSAAGNPLIGTGFESFWNVNIGKVATQLWYYWQIKNLVSAHNGYIEVYLDLGCIGVCLIALILITGYRSACNAFYRNPEVGALLLAYVATATIYSITEAGFRMLKLSWFFLLVAVVCSKGATRGLFNEQRATNKTGHLSLSRRPKVCINGAEWKARA